MHKQISINQNTDVGVLVTTLPKIVPSEFLKLPTVKRERASKVKAKKSRSPESLRKSITKHSTRIEECKAKLTEIEAKLELAKTENDVPRIEKYTEKKNEVLETIQSSSEKVRIRSEQLRVLES